MIIVDDREPKMVEHLKDNKVPTQIVRMEAGDFLLANSSPPVLIERKTWGDLLGSWFAGRVQEQMQKMSATTISGEPVRSAIMVEGSLQTYLRYRNVKRPSVAGMLASLFYDWKISLIPSSSMEMCAEILKSLDRMSAPQDANSQKPLYIKTAEISRTDCKLNMLACIDHVGGLTARRILERFKNITNIATASKEELLCLLGNKTGASVHAAFHEEYVHE